MHNSQKKRSSTLATNNNLHEYYIICLNGERKLETCVRFRQTNSTDVPHISSTSGDLLAADQESSSRMPKVKAH